MSKTFLVADIGGTNTNLALARHGGKTIELVFKERYSTQDERSLLEPVQRFLKAASSFGFSEAIDFCCVSGAGPVQADETIQLTNAPWSISASELSALLGVPVRLINDFTALSYAVTLLNYKNEAEITRLPHLDGSLGEPADGLMLIVGAGTGLGVGFVDRHGKSVTAYPSEGGHSELPCFDALSHDFHEWLSERYGYPAGAELAISGQGIANIFEFVCTEKLDARMIAAEYGIPQPGSGSGLGSGLDAGLEASLDAGPSELSKGILKTPRTAWPAAIAANSRTDVHCALTMELFVRLYALKAANLVSILLPRGGVWLAGGISSKNETWLLENHRFMRWFEKNYAPHIREFLSKTPVLIVKNYDISLLGAAEAAHQFSEHG
ncbi:MAG: glucokinase [Rectinema subterraneum]